jgi:HSP20 family molecular chaperone IbpA
MDEPKPQKEHRYMIEEITVTPFFKRHRGHMPATIKLSAEVIEAGSDVVLETDVTGYDKEDVEISATNNTIDITLVMERAQSGDIKFHNSYFTPVPINPDRMKIEQKNGKLKVTVPKK